MEIIAIAMFFIFIITTYSKYGKAVFKPNYILMLTQAKYYGYSKEEKQLLISLFRMAKQKSVYKFFKDSTMIQDCIYYISKFKQEKKYLNLLERLYKRKTYLEEKVLKKAHAKNKIKNSTYLNIGQGVTIELTNHSIKEHIKATIVESNDKSFVLATSDECFLSDGQITIRFLINTLGYEIKSVVIKQGEKNIVVKHAPVLLQRNRLSTRVKVDMKGEFFVCPIGSFRKYYAENYNGYHCDIIDISEGGVALLVEGKGKVGIDIKIQFTLDDKNIILYGLLKSVNYHYKKNQSILHVQLYPDIPFEMKEHLFSFIDKNLEK